MTNVMYPGDILRHRGGDKLESPNDQFYLTLSRVGEYSLWVRLNGRGDRVIRHSPAAGPGAYLEMLTTGSIALYNSSGGLVWHEPTHRAPIANSELHLQDDGQAVIYPPGFIGVSGKQTWPEKANPYKGSVLHTVSGPYKCNSGRKGTAEGEGWDYETAKANFYAMVEEMCLYSGGGGTPKEHETKNYDLVGPDYYPK